MQSKGIDSVTNFAALRDSLERMRGNVTGTPAASIIIPVNAQGDLAKVLGPLTDIGRYSGQHAIEVILVINNYPPDSPPEEIEQYQALGIRVVAVPNARRPGEVVIISARALGVQAAQSEVTIHFDADCRIPDSTALLDWYVTALSKGAKLAYTPVGFYDLPRRTAVRVKVGLHHGTRWLKRNLFGIPTTRGSNYGVNRSLFLDCYEAGQVSVDMQIGLAAQREKAHIVYSGHPRLKVLTSGRRNSGRWVRLLPYFLYRLRYNLKVLSIRRLEKPRDAWNGFDEETARRQQMILPGDADTPRVEH